jgi:hypothetical protein
MAGGKEMKRKMMMVFVGFTLFAGLCFACGTVNHNAESVSLMQLIVNPEKYHGKLVRVIGVSSIEFEGDGIWFTKEHYELNVYMNSLWIEPNYDALGATRQQLEQFNGKYVLIEGVFNKDNHGHLGMYGGAIEKVTRFQLWEQEEQTSRPTDAPSPPATTPSPDSTVWRKVRSPLFPSNWAPTAETVWVRYTFAYGINPDVLMDGEYVTKPLSKTECSGDVVKTTVLSDEMVQAAIQGVIPIDEATRLILQNEKPVTGDCANMTQLPDTSLPETKELLAYYRAWFKYNDAFLDFIRKDHADFIDWVISNE